MVEGVAGSGLGAVGLADGSEAVAVPWASFFNLGLCRGTFFATDVIEASLDDGRAGRGGGARGVLHGSLRQCRGQLHGPLFKRSLSSLSSALRRGF